MAAEVLNVCHKRSLVYPDLQTIANNMVFLVNKIENLVDQCCGKMAG